MPLKFRWTSSVDGLHKEGNSMDGTMAVERPPIIGVWQARGLIDLMDKFYSDPKNRAAYEKWKENKDKESNRQ